MKCPVIETLARVDVLCVDKTGTITENTMRVDEVIELNSASVGGRAALEKIIGDFARNMPADNITMEAMQTYFKENTGRSAVSITSFSSATKYSSVTFEENAYVFGAPEFVLRDQYETYKEQIETYSKQGSRVLVFVPMPALRTAVR